MHKILATAAASATAGIIALGLAAGPAQASTTTQSDGPKWSCRIAGILLTDFDAVDAAAGQRDHRISRADLKAAAEGKNGASGNLRVAAYQLLNQEDWLDYFDTYSNDRTLNRDGFITRSNLLDYASDDCNARW